MQLHRGLQEAGHESVVLSTDKGIDAAEAAELPPGVRLARARPPARMNFAPGIHALIRTEIPNADLVHVHGVDAYTSTMAMRAARSRSIPYLVQPHGAYDAYHRAQNGLVKRAWWRILDRSLLTRAAAIVVSSSRERDGARRLGLGDVTTIHICLGVDAGLFEIGRRSKGNQIVFLGRVTQKKRVDLALEGFAKSKVWARNVKLVIAGPIDARLTYDPRVLTERLGVAHSVAFLGTVDAGQRADLLAESDLFILPSEDESFGVAAAEALAAGVPVMISSNVGLVDYAGGDSGIRTVAMDSESIATAFDDAFSDSAEILAESIVAREFASKHFRWPEILVGVLDDYEKVISQ